MPELPEVETTRAGIAACVVGREVTGVVVRTMRLRLPVPMTLTTELPGQVVETVERRAKYLLLRAGAGTVILHLGMSGSLRLLTESVPPGPHDHLDITFRDGSVLRLNDPRRFGLALWVYGDPLDHPLLRKLGPEPLEKEFDGDYLYQRSRGRVVAIKTFLMDQRIVVGVGNIYAAESLFLAGIHPILPAGTVSQPRYVRLVSAVREILAAAIAQGGTTLRDFHDVAGRPGYFQRALCVYGRAGAPCPRCGRAILSERQGQRSTFYCAHCQR
ncbi:DNA-formamidopyrimidine glycosylase [Gammaproteobacteria bacterium]